MTNVGMTEEKGNNDYGEFFNSSIVANVFLRKLLMTSAV